jgi:hypothetical protein
MLNRRTFLGSAVAANAVLAGVTLLAQDQPNPDKDTGPHYRAKQILGSKVTIDENQSVGTVDDIVMDQNGNVDYLIVIQDNKLVSIPWDATQFNAEKRQAIVHIAPAKYQEIPTYAPNQYPTFNAPYRVKTYQYFGLTPHQQRRLIRRGGVVVQ